MASNSDNEEFVRELIAPSYALDFAIEFISEKFYPADVFSDKKLGEWAKENGWIKED